MGQKELLEIIRREAKEQTGELDLSVHQIKQLPTEIGQLRKVTTLDISYNKLTKLPQEIGQLTNLTMLDLSGNQLTELPLEIGQLTNLTTLNLFRNQLTGLPQEIGHLINLTNLDLRLNQLSQIPEKIVRSINLNKFGFGDIKLANFKNEPNQNLNIIKKFLLFNSTPYFPDGIPRRTRVPWYKKVLISMDELPLWSSRLKEDKHIYRFIWLRSFHSPVIIRLQIGEDLTSTLFVKVTNGRGDLGDKMKEEAIKLPKEKIKDFLSRLNSSNFWNLQNYEETFGLDGARWIIEGTKNGRYHIVDRWSPEDGKYREAALFLVKLADLRISNIY